MRIRKANGYWRVAENGKLVDVFKQKSAGLAKFDAMVMRHGGKMVKT